MKQPCGCKKTTDHFTPGMPETQIAHLAFHHKVVHGIPEDTIEKLVIHLGVDMDIYHSAFNLLKVIHASQSRKGGKALFEKEQK